MKIDEAQRDLDAEVSASLASLTWPHWLRMLSDTCGKFLVTGADFLFAFLARPTTLIRKIGPGKRPEVLHEFMDPAKRLGRWGGGPL